MTTDSACTRTWGCDEHTEDTYEGCYTCAIRDYSDVIEAKNAKIAELEREVRVLAVSNNRLRQKIDRLSR